MNFFEMLVLSQKLSFSDGRVTFYGQDILIFPVLSIMGYIDLIGNSTESTKEVYYMVKESMLENKQNLKKAYKPSDGVNWIYNTLNLYGLGKVSFGTSTIPPTGEIFVENSPFANGLNGKVNAPIDHILRGIIAGMVSAIFDNDYDVIEVECCVIGSNRCKLILDSKENLSKNFPSFCKNQV